MAEPGWHADPTGRYEQRWWDGERWADAVTVGGAAFSDPFGGEPPAPDRSVLERPTLAVDLGTVGLVGDGTWTIQERDGSSTLGYVQATRGGLTTNPWFLVLDGQGRTILRVQREHGLGIEVEVLDHLGVLVGIARIKGSSITMVGPGSPGAPGPLVTWFRARVQGLTWAVGASALFSSNGGRPTPPRLEVLDGNGAVVGAIDATPDEQGEVRWLLLDRDPQMPEPVTTLVVALLPVLSILQAETDAARSRAVRKSRLD